MQIHDLVQGSPEWHQFRLDHFGASEAAAMLGLSKKVKRSELLAMKHTGIAKEFSDWVQENILDYGHEVEALARPIVEKQEGIDLYPVTCSDGKLSASCDGLLMNERRGWEHKQWNAELAAAVAANELPDEFMVQPQQCLMVTGAESWKFTVSDGTDENMVSMEIFPDPVWFERIRAGWAQFEIDLENYVPPEVVISPVGRTPDNLPALHIEVSGMVKASNLVQYKEHALAVFKGINRDLVTDQNFADAEKTVKWCGDVEDRIAAAKQHALSQTATIDDLFRTLDSISAEARATRLELDRLVSARKVSIRLEIAQQGKDDYAEHIAALNTRLGKPYMPTIMADFAGVMKGKKTIASLRDAVSTELARVKIESNAVADKIDANLKSLRELAKDHISLFADTASIVLKSNDDLVNLINSRINEHKAAEAKKAEELRAKIAEEERVKAEAKARAEQAEIAAKERAEQAAIAEADRKKSEEEAIAASKLINADLEGAIKTAFVHDAATPSLAEVIHAVAPPAVAAAIAPVSPARQAPVTPPTLTLGKIGTRLGFNLTADFLRQLGFEGTREKGAVLFHESNWLLICTALIDHISNLPEEAKQAA